MGICWCGDPKCKLYSEKVKGEKVTTEVEKGSKVRVTFEGKFSHKSGNGKPVVHVENPGLFPSEFLLPKEAKLEVLEKPTPEEPPVGTVVRFADGAVFANTRMSIVTNSWIHVNRASGYDTAWFYWKDAVRKHGTQFVRLDQPQVDLSDVKPFELPPSRWDADGEEPSAVNYTACYSTAGSQVKVFRPDKAGHIRFNHGGKTFCLYDYQAIDIAKRILKTFEPTS